MINRFDSLPEFGRLKELCKLSALVRILAGIRKSNKQSIKALNSLIDATPAPSTETYNNLVKAQQETCNQVSLIFADLRTKASLSEIKEKWGKELTRIKQEMGTITSYNRSNYRSQLYNLFSSDLLNELGSYTYGNRIDSFLDGHIYDLRDALAKHEIKQIHDKIRAQFTASSVKDIALALEGNTEAIRRVGLQEVQKQFIEKRDRAQRIERGFQEINLGKSKEEIDLSDKCLWVPASIRHEAPKKESSQTRYSFFVYGGVNAQARLNIASRGNGPLGGRRVGGGQGDGSGGRGGGGPFNQRREILKNPLPRSLDNETTRKWYHQELKKMPSLIDKSLPLKEQALQAVKLRNEIKMKARELMMNQHEASLLPPPSGLKDVVKKAYDRGVAGEQMWEHILGGSQRTNKSVDKKFGMENNFASRRNKNE